jgi:hypothetical protein
MNPRSGKPAQWEVTLLQNSRQQRSGRVTAHIEERLRSKAEPPTISDHAIVEQAFILEAQRSPDRGIHVGLLRMPKIEALITGQE